MSAKKTKYTFCVIHPVKGTRTHRRAVVRCFKTEAEAKSYAAKSRRAGTKRVRVFPYK